MLFGRLPIRLTHRLSLYPAALVWALLRLGVRPIEYFRLIAKFDFPHLRAIVFDQMLPRLAHYSPPETVANMMAAAALRGGPAMRGSELWMARPTPLPETAQARGRWHPSHRQSYPPR